MTIRVLVADDQALVRGSFRILVDTAPDLTSVGEAASGAEAVELARSEKPDLVLMDIRMPGVDGIEATRQITADPQTSAVRVLILTTFDLDESPSSPAVPSRRSARRPHWRRLPNANAKC